MRDSHFLRVHRYVMLGLSGAFFCFCAWAFIAQIDIVVVAQGKVSPVTSVQVAQPLEGGIVRSVLVKDGDLVVRGQPLFEMDAVTANQDRAYAKDVVTSMRNRLARIDAELTGKNLDVADAGVMAEFIGRKAAQQSAVLEAQRARDGALAALRAAELRLTKYQELAPVTSRQTDMVNKLKSSGFISEASYNEKLMQNIEVSRERDVRGSEVHTAEAQLRQTEAALQKVTTEYIRQLSTERTDVALKLQQAEADLAKSDHRADLQVIKAPVSGVVTGLEVHAPGQVVASGAKLVSVVPADTPLQFEGWVRNEDAGFVIPDMAAKTKFTAYPFQKYGWITGQVKWVGVDAETPETMRNAQGEPLFYRIRVSLPKQSLTRDGATYALKPGMQATADLHAGTRTLFEYLTSPLKKVVQEAAREHQ